MAVMTRPKLTLSYPHPGTPPKYRIEKGGTVGTYLEPAVVGAFGSAVEVWVVEVRKETT
jgi:hypothetical protein